MCKRHIRQVISLAVALVMLTAAFTASAFYTPGGRSLSIGDIELSAGETVYDFYLPFDAAGLTFTASNAVAEISLRTGQQEVVLQNGTAAFSQVERKGARSWVFQAQETVTLSDVTVTQHNMTGLDSSTLGTEALVCDLSENEEAISAAVLIDRNASCVIVGGARRYIDNENPKETPAVIDGSIYLPGRVLALALGCYYESIPAKNYVLVRDDAQGREFYFTASGSYEQTEMGDKLPIDFHPVYKEGEVFLPVRCFAELLGKTVGYRDGIAVIDHAYSVQQIINTEVFSYVTTLFADFIPEQVSGQTYHVAQTDGADDANSGSSESPFRTLAKAGAVAEAGDTVIIHEGVYREILTPQNDGTATNPIVFRAAEGERVVLSATEEVTGFTEDENGRASAPVTHDLGEGRNQVFYQGECIIEARYPDGPGIEMSENGEALSALFPVLGDLRVSSEDNTVVTSDTLLQEEEANHWQGAAFVSLHGYGYGLGTAKVLSSEKGKLQLTDVSTKFWHTASEDNIWNFGYLSGHINAMNQPGEWVVQNGELIMLPPAGVSAEGLTVEMKARQITMDLSERKFVQVIGVESFGGGAKLNESEMCILNDVDMKYISHYTYSDDQREGYIDDFSDRHSKNGAPQRGEVGVYISGRDNAVIHSRFDHSAASALYLAGLYAYVDDNIISNCGYMGSYVSGITAYSEPWTEQRAPRGGFSVYNNTVYNSGRHLIVVQGNSDNGAAWSGKPLPFLPFEVAYNDFHDGCLFTLDTGITYAYWVSCSTKRLNSRIHSNYIYSTTPKSNPYSFGLYCDGGSLGIDGYSNMIFTTQPDTEFTYAYAFKNPTLSSSTLTNNGQLTNPVSGGAAGLTAEQFPKGKPFYAGALQGTEPYLKNYERADESVNYISVADAKITGSVTLAADGGAELADSEATVCFKDVNFDSGINQLHFYFGGDRYVNDDIMRVVIGSTPDAPDRQEVVLVSNADKLYQRDFVALDVGGRTGTQNVYVTLQTQTLRGTRLYGMLMSDDAKAEKEHDDGTNIAAVDYNSIYKMGQSGILFTTREPDYVRNTYAGTMLVYKNVTIDEAASHLKIAIGQSEFDRTVKIRINSPTAEPIVTYKNVASAFGDDTPKYAALTESLTAGSYDVYVEFSGASTSNFYSFGFVPENPLT